MPVAACSRQPIASDLQVTPLAKKTKCDAKMYHMTRASVRDLRYSFKKIERLLRQGEEIQITHRRRVIGRLIPERDQDTPAEVPDFLERLRVIYGDRALSVTGADLVAEDRSRY